MMNQRIRSASATMLLFLLTQPCFAQVGGPVSYPNATTTDDGVGVCMPLGVGASICASNRTQTLVPARYLPPTAAISQASPWSSTEALQPSTTAI